MEFLIISVFVVFVLAIVYRYKVYTPKNTFITDYNNESKNLDNVLVTNFKKDTDKAEVSTAKEIVFEKPVTPVSVITPVTATTTATVTELKPKKPRKTTKVKLDVKKALPAENTKQKPAVKVTTSRAKKVKENVEVETKVVSVKPKRSKTDKK
jgi:hypothetical protein